MPTHSPLDVPLFVADWPEYFKLVMNTPNHRTEERLAVLDEARRLFSDHVHFKEMSDDDRRGIAGFGKAGQLDWGWFGSMMGAGYFKQAVNSNSPQLSAALDEIPLTGEVTEAHFNRYRMTFRNAVKTPGIATATRLLAMKRPDYFLCLDCKNQRKLCEAFKIPQNVNLDGYWEKVSQRLYDSNWWNAQRPGNELQKRVWECRAAFLDVLFYEP